MLTEWMERIEKVLVDKVEKKMDAAGLSQSLDLLLNAVEDIGRQLERLEQKLNAGVEREAYTAEQVAERLRRTPWTVRQWCNLGQVPGALKVPGKGRKGEWRIPHEVLLWLEKEGPVPVRKRLAS